MPSENAFTSGLETFVDRVLTAVHGLLQPSDMRRVAGIAIGAAGMAPEFRERVCEGVRAGLVEHSPAILVQTLSDAEVAFSSTGAGDSGVVIIAGTGAIASQIDGGREVKTIDGNGPQLGDLGSGYWIGMVGAQRALRAAEGVGPPTLLTDRIRHRLGDPDSIEQFRWAMISKYRDLAVPEIAKFAEDVVGLADEHDDVALAIVREAVAHLTDTVRATQYTHNHVLVLAGSLLANDTAISRGLRAELSGDFTTIMVAKDPVMGALTMARNLVRTKQASRKR
jgi:N-acetylglucosamine kinase-like BadF-type ATPase